MLRDDVRELRRVADQALRNGEECWPVLPDGGSDGDSETYRRIKFRVNQSSVTQGDATFTVDNVRPICGGVNPVASTADGVNLTINDAVGSYTDNQEGVGEWDNDNSEWIDVTDQSGDSTPQTYNVKLQAALTKAATSVSVKWLDASLVEFDAAFTAYDPHQQFSSGYGVTDALGRVAKVTDADTGAERWELTHLVSLARYVKGTLAENEGATTAGKASCTSYTAYGNGWHETSPVGTINFVGLSGQKTGDTIVGVLVDPDATLPEYLAVEVPELDRLVKVNASESAAGYLADQLVNTGTLTSGYQRVYFRTAGDNDTMYAETEEAAGGSGEPDETFYGVCAATSIANAASGSVTLQTSSSCGLTAGSSITACNKTGKYIWQDSICTLRQAPDGAYHIVASDSAYVVRGTASGDSNYGNSYTSFSISTPDPLLGTQAPASVSGISNPYSLRVNTDDNVTIAHDAGDNAWICLRSEGEPVLFGKIGQASEEIDARSGTTVGKGLVAVYEIDTSDDGLDATAETQTWYNMADEPVANGAWVMAKPVQAADGDTLWVIDWEQCS